MKNELLDDLNFIIERLSRPQLTTWIDTEALRILELKYEILRINELVYYLHGSSALFPAIRFIFINTFSLQELKNLAEDNGLPQFEKYEKYLDLKVFIKLFNFSTAWKEESRRDFENIGKICPSYNLSIASLGRPHYYQKYVKDYCINWFLEGGNSKSLVSMPTGSGKTRTANEFLIDLFRINKVRKVLWLAHRRELLFQTAKSFEKLHIEKGDDCVILKFNFDQYSNWFELDDSKEITYSSYDKIDDKIVSTDHNIDLIVIDEAHYTTANTYEPKVKRIISSNNAKLLGLTATPMRADDDIFLNLLTYYQHTISLSDVFGSTDPLKKLQDEEYLAHITYDYLNIPTVEFRPESVILNEAIINKCKRFKLENKNILIFAMSKAHAIAINAMLNMEGVASSCIIGETLLSDRAHMMEAFGKKDITALVNYDILTTGVDIPGMNGILVLRNFNERHTAIQVLGRALRGPKNGGNKNNSVIFINEVSGQNINDLYNY